jgi:chitinase
MPHPYARSISRLRWSAVIMTLLCSFLFLPATHAQVNTGGSATTANHQKQIVGYITNWDAWKSANHGVPGAGSLTHLNIDYSKYTILNFSFFGVARDGSLHSGDFRNKQIYQPGQVQEPAQLLHGGVFDSWDMHLIFGELEYKWDFTDPKVQAAGFVADGAGWKNTKNGISGPMPVPLHKEGGVNGLIDMAHQHGVKVMASIGGWSMCRHYPEMAADPAKRAKFVADCKRLIGMGFDGIDFDWEYPGPYAGMNFTGTQADFANFTTLVQEIRQAIGATKLITAAFSASPSKLQGFNWSALGNLMNYFNMMTYDFNGGWSTIAGHNAPLYDYPGAEVNNFSWNATYQALTSLGVPAQKINMGAPFYGRGVITSGAAALNAPTQKTQRTIDPDGPVSTAADYSNWGQFDGTPNYEYIRQKKGSWTEHWDDNAKVPYLTNGNYFLSYDNERSIGLKAQYVVDKGLAGVIVWTVFGDLEVGGSATTFGSKLVRYSSVKSPLVNKLNEVFAQGNTGMPVVSITSPVNGATVTPGSSVVINATASDAGGSISKVEFLLDGAKVGEDASSPYSYTINTIAAGNHTLSAKATDNSGNTASASVSINASTNTPPVVSISSPSNGTSYTAGNSITITAQATDNGSIAKTEFYQGTTKLGEVAASPYSFTWSNVQAGSYALTVVATDNEGATATSAVVNVTVTGGSNCPGVAVWQQTAVYTNGMEVQYNGIKYVAQWWTQNENPETHSGASGVWKNLGSCGQSNVAPVVAITAPANGQSFTTGATVTITATASDTDGTVTRVEFYQGGIKLGEDTSSPYSVTWSAGPVGNYVLTATAYDNSGASAVSHAVNIVVTGGTNTPPVVNITSPANGASYPAPACITIDVSASDADGSIVKVEFYNGSNKIGEDISSPYSFSWCNVQAGSYSITARATDNGNALTTSSAVTVTVTSADNCNSLPQYTENNGYVAGSVVKNAGSYYECKEWPYSGWCNGAAWAYAPGTGTYWQDAWRLSGNCAGSALLAAAVTEDFSIGYHPNPFTDKLSIDIVLEQESDLSLVLFDFSGTAVQKVFSGRKEAGHHQFDVNGLGLSPGVYILKAAKGSQGSPTHIQLFKK